MTKLVGTLVVSGTLALLPAMALAQEDQEQWSELGTEPEVTAPPTAAPSEAPPAPQYPAQTESPPPPQYGSDYQAPPPAPQAEAQASAPAGQWVYTQQYGWIWMPYSDAYTYAPASGYGEPYAYVYYPAYSCWTWIAAPWVWGIGPWPFFGVFGPAHFAWYGHGWWRCPGRWHYAPLHSGFAGFRPAPAFRGGAVGGFRSAPAPAFRGGTGGFRSAPAPFRGGAAARPGFAGGRPAFAPHGAPAVRGGFAQSAPRAFGRGGAPGFASRGGSAGGHGGFSGGRGGFTGGHGGGSGGRGAFGGGRAHFGR